MNLNYQDAYNAGIRLALRWNGKKPYPLEKRIGKWLITWLDDYHNPLLPEGRQPRKNLNRAWMQAAWVHHIPGKGRMLLTLCKSSKGAS